MSRLRSVNIGDRDRGMANGNVYTCVCVNSFLPADRGDFGLNVQALSIPLSREDILLLKKNVAFWVQN